MALQEINPSPKLHHGGGFMGALGSILGAVGGAALAPFTGGSSLAAAALGSTLGGTAGGMVDQATAGGGQKPQARVSQLQSIAKADPNIQLAAIENARQAIPQAGLSGPEAEATLAHLNAGRDQLKKIMGMGVV